MAARDEKRAENKEPPPGAGIAAPATLDGKALLSLPAKSPGHTICGQTARFSSLPAL